LLQNGDGPGRRGGDGLMEDGTGDESQLASTMPRPRRQKTDPPWDLEWEWESAHFKGNWPVGVDDSKFKVLPFIRV
jgi:hypothetical protein